ncbi:hypothetical protein DIPPA_29566, partial [Diplonema papillatum]
EGSGKSAGKHEIKGKGKMVADGRDSGQYDQLLLLGQTDDHGRRLSHLSLLQSIDRRHKHYLSMLCADRPRTFVLLLSAAARGASPAQAEWQDDAFAEEDAPPPAACTDAASALPLRPFIFLQMLGCAQKHTALYLLHETVSVDHCEMALTFERLRPNVPADWKTTSTNLDKIEAGLHLGSGFMQGDPALALRKREEELTRLEQQLREREASLKEREGKLVVLNQGSDAYSYLSKKGATTMGTRSLLNAVSPRKLCFEASGVAIDDEELRDLFSTYDSNDDGSISRSEFKHEYRRFETFGLPISDREVDSTFSQFGGRDDRLSYNEFCVLMLQRAKM